MTPHKDLGLAKAEEQFWQWANPMCFTCCDAPGGVSTSTKSGWTGDCQGAGMLWEGIAPSTPRAQGIVCSQGLQCAEPVLKWQWGNSLSPVSHCDLPTEGGRNLALLTGTEGVSKASALVLGLWGCPWHVLSVLQEDSFCWWPVQ